MQERQELFVSARMDGPQSWREMSVVRLQATQGQGVFGRRQQPDCGQVSGPGPEGAGDASSLVVYDTTSTGGRSPEPAAATTSSPTPAASGAHNKMDAAKVTEILNETNKMLKSLTTQQPQAPSVPAPPADPLELIQKQLDEVRRLKVMTVREPCEVTSSFTSALSWYEARLSSSRATRPYHDEGDEALLDSGATHAYRPPSSAIELEGARRVGVSLATGEERVISQNRGGTLLSESGSEGTILPMGQLVQLLGCRVTWTPNKLTVVHPVHGRLQVRLRGHCPVIPVTQALDLIAELEQKRMASFERTVQDLQKQSRPSVTMACRPGHGSSTYARLVRPGSARTWLASSRRTRFSPR